MPGTRPRIAATLPPPPHLETRHRASCTDITLTFENLSSIGAPEPNRPLFRATILLSAMGPGYDLDNLNPDHCWRASNSASGLALRGGLANGRRRTTTRPHLGLRLGRVPRGNVRHSDNWQAVESRPSDLPSSAGAEFRRHALKLAGRWHKKPNSR